ncbi:MAG: 1-deoxy-D-xylulose-5-phosphate synthase, partial [Lachnospiraceae bacterium]|nr:1-deoxy-D-xylulose-5-phosphate synthase [Lachnospiraceae bacterium]
MTDYPVLDKINKENDIKKLPENEWPELARELRCFLTENVSKTGGHLSSNLGVVELTMALHLFLDLPKDKVVFDVGHQTYIHKILTGRKNFETLRQKGGLSGFPKGSESDCDAFDTGHSSTSLSVVSGLVTARELKGEKNKIVAVIGDGALGGGMAIEALNNIGKFKSNLIIILNDNEMSIDQNVGGMANYLGQIRTKKSYVNFKSGLENILDEIPGGSGERIVGRLKHIKDSLKTFFVSGMLFEDLGITYIGPINGHDVHQVLTALKSAARVDKPVIIHAITQKGKGYIPAEKRPGKFHGIGPFDLKTGKIIKKPTHKTFTESFSEAMVELGDKDSRLIGITAAMEFGTGLREFGECHPDRFFDVGIAEQHAVTFAAALAKSGFRPVVAIYSTFLQRSYDQIL